MSFFPQEVGVEFLVVDTNRSTIPLGDPKDDDLGFCGDSATIIFSFGDEDLIDFNDFAFAAKHPLHPPVLVGDERVDQLGDVTQIPPHRPAVKSRKQNRRLVRDSCDETVAHKDERRDVFDFVALKDAAPSQRWTPFLALFAVCARK